MLSVNLNVLAKSVSSRSVVASRVASEGAVGLSLLEVTRRCCISVAELSGFGDRGSTLYALSGAFGLGAGSDASSVYCGRESRISVGHGK